jgi:hypothetical protein
MITGMTFRAVGLFVAAATCVPAVAMGEVEATPAPPEVAPAPVPAAEAPPDDWRQRLQLDGLLDLYYAYQVGGGGVEDLTPHLFDEFGNTFMLAFARLGLGVRPEPVGLRLDLGWGHVADVVASDLGQVDAAAIRFVQQAYVTFAPALRVPLTLDIGKFESREGVEAIEANRNWNYTRSYLFTYATPFTYTGFRVTVSPVPGLTLTGLLVNGWDLVIDNNGEKTMGLSVSYAAPTGTTVSLAGLAGIEVVGNDPPWRLLLDLVVAQKLGRLELALNADAAREGSDRRWYGAAAYARYFASDWINLAFRAEVFVDHAGLLVPNVDSRVEDLTFTTNFRIARNLAVLAEARADFGNHTLFIIDGTPKSNQYELAAAALAWF